ncbi:MAG TPA: PAAR-like domain-containing protein [Myxococcaceae bacterium]|nr:PAAR-like domain-containing protein [Myxococcaceae bacterium]
MAGVFANGRSILHKGDGKTQISAPPDVCKVPTPGGPVPTPFVNSAQDSMLAKGSKTTKIEGNPVALDNSEISTSSGDEPGTAGGLLSSKFKGKLTWNGASTDVKIEGKGVVRFLDPTLHNGNTSNVFFATDGCTGLAYGDDSLCIKCEKSPNDHRIHETKVAQAYVDDVFLELARVLKKQKSKIERHCRLIEARRKAKAEADKKTGPLKEKFEAWKTRKRADIKIIEEGFKSPNANKEQIRAKVKAAKSALAEAESKMKMEVQKLEIEVRVIQADIDTVGRELSAIHVLRYDPSTRSYTWGYMVGACICKCPEEPQKLVACSGMASPGFKKAVKAAGFTHVERFEPSEIQKPWLKLLQKSEEDGLPKWECAAPQLIANAGGHKIGAMSERFYSPLGGATSPITVMHKESTGQSRPHIKNYSHGESVPSCEKCQVLLPAMLCENKKECP